MQTNLRDLLFNFVHTELTCKAGNVKAHSR